MHFPFPVYFCRHVPIERLNLRRNVSETIKAPWFEALKEDIDKNGLASPLLVLHYANEPLIKPVPMSVKTGQNRLRALRQLGWKYVPCIIVGRAGDPPPEGLELEPLHTLAECQALLGDGIIAWQKYESLRINSALLPEQGKFPKPEKRYLRDDSAGS